MQCPSCGTTNPEDALYCLKCGKKISGTCPKCKSAVGINDAFCKKCGEPLKSGNKSQSSQPADLVKTVLPEEEKKKTPILNIVVIAAIVLFCIIAVIASVIIFSKKPAFLFGEMTPTVTVSPLPSATWTVTPLPSFTPTITQTATPEITPTPSYESIDVNFLCAVEEPQFVLEHQPVNLLGGWGAVTEEQVQDFLDNSQRSFFMDGVDITPLVQYAQPYYNQDGGVYVVEYGINSEPLPLGVHQFSSVYNFEGTFTDGVNQYGPGTANPGYSNDCAIIVGSSDPSWNVIAASDFSQDQKLFKSGQTSGDYGNSNVIEGKDGLLKIDIERASSDWVQNMYPVIPAGQMTNTFFTVQASASNGWDDVEYGIYVRQVNQLGYYKLSILPGSQTIRFSLIYNGEESYLFEKEVPGIITSGLDEITLMADGSNFAFWVNHKFVGYAEDATLSEAGKSGLIVVTKEQGLFSLTFDNLVVRGD